MMMLYQLPRPCSNPNQAFNTNLLILHTASLHFLFLIWCFLHNNPSHSLRRFWFSHILHVYYTQMPLTHRFTHTKKNMILHIYEEHRTHYRVFECLCCMRFGCSLDAIWFLPQSSCYCTFSVCVHKELKSASVTVTLDMFVTSYLFICFVNKNYKYKYSTTVIC